MVALAGCGRIGFTAAGGVGDDFPSGDDGGGSDAASGCATTAWGGFVHQSNLESISGDWEPALSTDGLHVIFQSQRNATRQLFYASRTSTDGEFGVAMLLGTTINVPGDNVNSPHWARDGHFEYEHQASTGGSRLVESRTVDTSAAITVFGAATQIDTDPIGSQIVETSDQVERWLTDDVGASPNEKHTLRYQRRASTMASWIEQALPSTFNAMGVGNDDGWVTYDETRHELWWERGRPGATGIVSATRSAEGAAFDSTVTAHPELGSSGDPDLSADGMVIVFASAENIAGFSTMGANDIYTATRTCQ
ncbi:hypothetical protein BH11MYX2_BH11MYX2_33560 [soil metagenome]